MRVSHVVPETTMSPQQALQIVQQLADGIDPTTGEVLSAESPFNQPEVIRALNLASNALKAHGLDAKAAPTQKPRPENAGRSWSPQEDAELLAEFDAGIVPKELAVKHGRTKGAIESRLVKHGRIQR